METDLSLFLPSRKRMFAVKSISLIIISLGHWYFSKNKTNKQTNKQTSKLAKSLEENSKALIEWLKYNKMDLNPDKCHLTLN